MAFNRNGDNKGFQRPPQPSAPIDTYFSSDYKDGNYQSVKISTYGERISFNFTKGRKGDQNSRQTSYVMFDYCTICSILAYIIEPLIVQRAMKFKSGEEYPVGTWLNIPITFTDNETKQVRTSGNFIIKSEVDLSNRNTVYICYQNGADEWKVAFGAPSFIGKTTLENPQTDGLDPSDARFQQFGYMLKSIVNNWVMIQMTNHQIGLMMNNFNAIKTKLGIEPKRFSGKDNGNYTDSNYRSSAPDADDGGSTDVGGFGNDMPF